MESRAEIVTMPVARQTLMKRQRRAEELAEEEEEAKIKEKI